jgi:RNA polymerase sigma factor (sigma-70 family)
LALGLFGLPRGKSEPTRARSGTVECNRAAGRASFAQNGLAAEARPIHPEGTAELADPARGEPVRDATQALRGQQTFFLPELYRSYPRLTQPPLSLQADELLGAVAERLLKALREVRPQSVRQFFALANKHVRWELNDLARRLDEQPAAVELREGLVPAPESSASGLTPNGRRMLEAIENLPEDEREVFGLVRIQGMTQTEAAQVLGVSVVTVKRRLNRCLRLLTEKLADLRPSETPPGSI